MFYEVISYYDSAEKCSHNNLAWMKTISLLSLSAATATTK